MMKLLISISQKYREAFKSMIPSPFRPSHIRLQSHCRSIRLLSPPIMLIFIEKWFFKCRYQCQQFKVYANTPFGFSKKIYFPKHFRFLSSICLHLMNHHLRNIAHYNCPNVIAKTMGKKNLRLCKFLFYPPLTLSVLEPNI